MSPDERFPPNRKVGQHKGDWVSKATWLTITPNGPRQRDLYPWQQTAAGITRMMTKDMKIDNLTNFCYSVHTPKQK